jgi:anti-sigma regulatory factor (Ser/Thr protein kinase)
MGLLTILGASWCLYMNYTSRYVLTSIDDIKKVVGGVLSGVEKINPLTDECRFNISLVIKELLVNCFKHAMPSKKAPVIFKAELKNSVLTIGVKDSGGGFEYEKVCANISNDEDALLKERGRGLTLVNALCQEIHYNNVGNSVEVKIAL